MRLLQFTCLATALLTSCLVPLHAQTPPPASPTVPGDPGWPREVTKNGVKLVYYQPQIDSWDNYRDLRARVAFSLTTADGKNAMGVASLSGSTTTNFTNRTVYIRNLAITDARFPSVPAPDAVALEATLKSTFPSKSLTVSLDRMTAGFDQAKASAKPIQLEMTPPPIYASTTPAVLLMVEGKPVTAPIVGTSLQFVVNTNWDLFFDDVSTAFYFLCDGIWLTSLDLKGPWTLATGLPDGFGNLPADDQWKNVRAAMPINIQQGTVVPAVIYSETPAELILFNGEPVWEKIIGTPLLWADNSDSWVFSNSDEGQIYYLVSGRWFRSKAWTGPWSYAGNDLPAAFAKIPQESPCADVLASIPGTPEAADAVLLAQIPTQSVVNKQEAAAKMSVSYAGDPDFQTIQGTSMAYATNTNADVIRLNNQYYACENAVWFQAAAASGPWTVCDSVPDAIYTIPPSCPVYNVTYVTAEPGEDENSVVCSYTSGYTGAYIAGVASGATLVWGTGYYYRPYVAWGGAMPVYYPYAHTYGFAANYNTWTGGYAVGQRVYGPYASAGRAAWYNPRTGNYGRVASVSTPYGSRTIAGAYNPRNGNAWATRQGSNGFAQWGTTAVSRGDNWVQGGHVVTDNGGAARWSGSDGAGRVWSNGENSGGAAVHDGDVYAGRDGNVYRRSGQGDWDKYDNGNWNSVNKGDLNNDSFQNLNHDSFSRNLGDSQLRTRSSFQDRSFDGGSRSFGGSYRSGGGGGGRRR